MQSPICRLYENTPNTHLSLNFLQNYHWGGFGLDSLQLKKIFHVWKSSSNLFIVLKILSLAKN